MNDAVERKCGGCLEKGKHPFCPDRVWEKDTVICGMYKPDYITLLSLLSASEQQRKQLEKRVEGMRTLLEDLHACLKVIRWKIPVDPQVNHGIHGLIGIKLEKIDQALSAKGEE